MKTVIGCSNSYSEAERLAKDLGYNFVKCIKRYFADGEVHVHLERSVSGEVLIYQSMYPAPNDSLIEVLLAADLLKNNKITLISPWFAYSRQDKQWYKTEAYSLKTVVKLLRSVGIRRVIAFDVHFHRKPGRFKMFGLDWLNLSAAKALVDYVKKEWKDLIIIGPDEGSSEMLKSVDGKVVFKKTKLCKLCNNKAQECTCESKKKEYDIVTELKTPIKESNILILDDIISSGGTILKAIDKLGSKNIAVAATHGFFFNECLNKFLDKTKILVTTNSIKTSASKVDLVPLIAEVLN